MASNLCGRFCLNARRLVIEEFDTRNFESVLVGELIPSSSYISSDHIQDIRTLGKVALMRKVLL